MPGIDEILKSSGLNLGDLGARFGLSPEQTSAAIGSLMPAVLGGMQKKAGAGDLGPVESAGSQPPSTGAGDDVLAHIFGSKDVSRQVADHASGESGLPSEVLKAMLPIVAAMAARHVVANRGAATGGGLGGLLGSVLGGSDSAGGLGGLLGGGGAGGNPLDQILARMR